jgi:RNA polymerase sigma factor (sigma-70 family)
MLDDPDRRPQPPARPAAATAAAAAGAAGGRPLNVEILALLAQTRGTLKALFLRDHVPHAAAEDIVQSALVIVVQNWRHLRDPAAYFCGTVRNGIQRHFTQLSRERTALSRLALQSPPAAADDREHHRVECREDVRQLLACLPRAAAHLLAMRYAEDRSAHEVAVALGSTEAAVRQAASRALRNLRRQAQAAAIR